MGPTWLRTCWALLGLAVPLSSGAKGPALPNPRPSPRLGTTRPIPRTASVRAIRGLYDAFNARDAERAGSFLTDDCVYEDLLLGPATVCRGKESFIGALSMHPAFISDRFVAALPREWRTGLPGLELVVDSVADGVGAVGVEWHVELGGSAIPLGRGLTHAIICQRTGKISRVVDIAEAPWRTVGLALAPAVTLARNAAALAEDAVGMLRADRQNAALAFASIWCALSIALVSWWVFGYGQALSALEPIGPPREAPVRACPGADGGFGDEGEFATATRRRAYVWWEAEPSPVEELGNILRK
jgi:hypothetical protein